MIYRTLPEAVITESEVKYLLTDHLGSVLRVMRADGSTESIHSYDEFGICEGKEPIYAGYGGYIPAGEDIYATESRYYAPKLGRFLSKDTWKGNIGNPQTWNQWIYVLNNPLRYKDASGYTPAEAMGNTYRQGIPESLGAYGAYSMLKADAGCGSIQTEVRSGYQAFQNQLRGESYHQLLNLAEAGTGGLNAYQGMNLTTPSLAGSLLTDGMISGGMSYSSICKLLGINSGTDNISYLDGIEATDDDMLVQGTYSEGEIKDIMSDMALQLGTGIIGVVFQHGENRKVRNLKQESDERAEANRKKAKELAEKEGELSEEDKKDAKRLIKLYEEWIAGTERETDEEKGYITLLENKVNGFWGFLAGYYAAIPFGDKSIEWIDKETARMLEPNGEKLEYSFAEQMNVAFNSQPQMAKAGMFTGGIATGFVAVTLLGKIPGVKGLKQKAGGMGGKLAAKAGLGPLGQALSGKYLSNVAEGLMVDAVGWTLPNAIESIMDGESPEDIVGGIVSNTGESLIGNATAEAIAGGIDGGAGAVAGVITDAKSAVPDVLEAGGDAAKNTGQALEEATESAAKNGVDVIDDVIEGGTDALKNGDSKVISSMSKEQLQANLPEGWTYTEHNGRVHIKDADGNFRVRIDLPDKVTSYQHMHILDELGNPLDIDGNIVSPKSPDGHIPWDN